MTNTPSHGDILLEQETANYLQLKPATLRRWRWAGKELPFVKCGGRVRYLRSDLDAWISKNRRGSTSEV
jgi:excisionase family DNA binding protein